jgi:hypothetical protein
MRRFDSGPRLQDPIRHLSRIAVVASQTNEMAAFILIERFPARSRP